MAELPEKLCRITGIGQSEVGRPSAKSPIELTLDAALGAIADAGLRVADIDGIVNYPPKTDLGGGISPVGVNETMQALGIEAKWIGVANHEGPGHMGAIFAAIMAVASGLCRHVLVFRTVAQAQARLKSREATLLAGSSRRVTGNNAWTVPFRAVSPANMWALYAQAYFDKYGAGPEQLGWVAVNARRNAALNPNAVYRDPLTIEDYLASRMISTPLRLYDCDTHIDGSTALVISHRDAAGDCRNPPIHFEAMGMALGGLGEGIHRGDFTALPADKAGEMLWSRTDLTPRDLSCAQIYDGFSIHTWLWGEALKLWPRGEAGAFFAGGHRIALDGELPINTGGGQLSGGRFHGYGHTYEACLQLWGRGGARQVRDARVSAVCNGGYGYGALLLRRD
ncbi:thiolase family protein [Novosphingobium sp. TH158]|uniref:thiolase family protein n=1 Tax=Novosphingobium sp. TH158 TaxID=2067455 RepID=UPI000C7987CC|nr:thiolase family protein [Novosphingobium sp. TH158]PLK26959.1 acetyl-CoA acetyltransferase [Novosphingobium sp. TH158]